MDAPLTTHAEADCEALILKTLRQLAVRLSVYDPDHPLHDEFVSIGQRGAELSPEGLQHLCEVAALATTGATRLAELKFSTVDEVPDSCREILAEAREGISELSWILWGISIALEYPEGFGEPPGRPPEILSRCAWVSSQLYSTSTSREGVSTLRGRRHAE